MVPTVLATARGWRSGRMRTEVPSRIVRVTAPTQARAVRASRYGIFGGQGAFRSALYGYRLRDCSGIAMWSVTDTDAKPRDSAGVATAIRAPEVGGGPGSDSVMPNSTRRDW